MHLEMLLPFATVMNGCNCDHLSFDIVPRLIASLVIDQKLIVSQVGNTMSSCSSRRH